MATRSAEIDFAQVKTEWKISFFLIKRKEYFARLPGVELYLPIPTLRMH